MHLISSCLVFRETNCWLGDEGQGLGHGHRFDGDPERPEGWGVN